MKLVLYTVISLIGLASSLAQTVHPTVKDAIYEGYFVNYSIVLFSADSKIEEATLKVLKQEFLVQSFGYWISVEKEILPSNFKITKSVKFVLSNLKEEDWLWLESFLSEKGSATYLWWYHRKDFSDDFKKFKHFSESE